MHNEMHFVDAMIAWGRDFLPCVDIVLDEHSVGGGLTVGAGSAWPLYR